VPLQWRNQIWQSLEEGAGKRCSECACHHHSLCCSGETGGVVGRHRAVEVVWSSPCPQAVVEIVEAVGKDHEW